MGERVLITGRAGSGKTRSILLRAADLIRRHREEGCLLLLPTQSQVDHLKGLLLRDAAPTFRDSFAHTFFTFSRTLFRGLPESLLSEQGRDYLILDLLSGGDFPAFEKVKGFPGFRRLLGEAFQELKLHDVTGEEYPRRVLGPLGGEREAAPRHRDLGRAFSAYRRLLRERRRWDQEDLLLEAAGRLESEPGLLAERTLLLVDGFHDFTPAQLRVLKHLSARIPESVFTLSFDPERPDDPAFRVSAATRLALEKLGFREEGLRGNHRTRDPTLLRMERDLFTAPEERAEAGASFRILQAARQEGEVEAIARAILRLSREEGVAWRDMAVLFHDLSGVTDLVEGTFQRFQIPVRVCQPRPLDRQPVVRFLLDLGGMLISPIDSGRFIRLLRSTYVARLPLSEVDRLDAHLRENPAPADPGEWMALSMRLDLPGVKRALQEISRGRDKVARRRETSRFGEIWREAFRVLVLPEGNTPTEGGEALGETGARGPHECAAQETFWRVVEEALRPGREGHGGKSPLPPLLKEIEAETAETSFRVRDRRREAVNVIDAREARQWEVPHLFVAGVLERQFPPMPMEGLFFNDEDRRRLSRSGLPLPDRARRQEEERFLFYTAVTRARERLTLSYPATDERGNPTLPSFFLREIRRIFTPESVDAGTTRLSASAVVPPPEELCLLEEVDRAIFAGLEDRSSSASEGIRATALTASLYNRRLEDAQFRSRLAALMEGTVPHLADPGILLELASADVAFSNSSLTAFLQCPYLHFVKKWLRLKPLPGREMEPFDLGNVIHAVLRECLQSEGSVDPLEALDRHFGELSAGKRNRFRHRAEYWRLRRALGRFLPGEMDRNRRLGLSPGLFEISFGTAGERATSPVLLEAGGRREKLSGQIDRVDLLPGGREGVVVDYKYSAGGAVERQRRESAGEEITNFQLALYLLALRESLGLEPAGAELVALKKKVERYGVGRRGILERSGLAGSPGEDWLLLDEEGFQSFLERARERMAELAGSIRAGVIDTRPADLSACGPGVCDAADICRYDRWLGGGKGEE